MSFSLYTLVRSKRKSMALVVGRDATLTVRAPLRFPIDRIESFIDEKRQWIDRAVEKMRIRATEEKKHRYEDGEVFWYLGEQYPLRLSCRSRRALVFSGGEFVLAERFRTRARDIFADWYRREAKKILPERVRFFARKFDILYRSVKINAARTRWGSCSGKGNINFSLRLAMTSHLVIDSVVAHELAHIAHRNHSLAFWREVTRLYPDYESARKWLEENKPKLTF